MKKRIRLIATAIVDMLPVLILVAPIALALIISHYNGMPGDIRGLGMMALRSPVTAEWVGPDGKQVVFSNANGSRKLIELSDYDLKQMLPDDRPMIGRRYEIVTFPTIKYGQGLRLRRM